MMRKNEYDFLEEEINEDIDMFMIPASLPHSLRNSRIKCDNSFVHLSSIHHYINWYIDSSDRQNEKIAQSDEQKAKKQRKFGVRKQKKNSQKKTFDVKQVLEQSKNETKKSRERSEKQEYLKKRRLNKTNKVF